ncbi:hypothetical protein FRC20_005151 [Serendipita sp. 405]|nr:hypothetical protein FRC20_005151 [Serendipita sp. 405]
MAETVELPTFFDPTTCVRRGLCPVMPLQNQQTSPIESHSLYFEQHGTGPEKVVLIMGLNTTSFAWGGQVPYLAKTHSVLVLDNRGVGNSDTPKGPYTTTAMADDVIALLDYIGWNKGRELHIVGVSLGGMISQELSLKIPERILSLSLVVTKAGTAGLLSNLTPWKGISTLASITFAKDDDKRADLVLPMLYPDEWLDLKSERETANAQTNREFYKADLLRRIEVQRKQTLGGSFSQMAAVMTHKVSPERLNKIGTSIPKILILTGDIDHLIRPVNSEWLHEHIPQAEYQVWKGAGHGLIGQFSKRFNELLDKVIKEGRENAGKPPFV